MLQYQYSLDVLVLVTGESINKQINLYLGRMQINLISLNFCLINNRSIDRRSLINSDNKRFDAAFPICRLGPHSQDIQGFR